jgi:hypothetical protein
MMKRGRIGKILLKAQEIIDSHGAANEEEAGKQIEYFRKTSTGCAMTAIEKNISSSAQESWKPAAAP